MEHIANETSMAILEPKWNVDEHCFLETKASLQTNRTDTANEAHAVVLEPQCDVDEHLCLNKKRSCKQSKRYCQWNVYGDARNKIECEGTLLPGHQASVETNRKDCQ